MTILGIETSCDETAAAVVRGPEKARQSASVRVVSNIVSSQIDIHQKYGGVVPEVAAREHVLQILPVINEALKTAGIKRGRASQEIDAMAAVTGPGLITSLMVGVETAKTLAYAWQIPVIAINHIEGHIYANFVSANSKSQTLNPKQMQNAKCKMQNINFPALILTVSGGHTMLVLMTGHGKYKTIGDTRDDAAGEAFDKAANLLGLGYPGGPAIAAEAKKLRVASCELRVQLPRPMINSISFDFSFSGLKTALLYAIKKDKDWKKRIPAYAHEFQQAVIDVLISKTIKAGQKYNVSTIMLAGGVSANTELRQQMTQSIKNNLPQINFIMPDLKYTTDNAVMVAAAGYFKALRKEFTPWPELKVDCNQKL